MRRCHNDVISVYVCMHACEPEEWNLDS
jgi:hypothetical protein